MCDLQYGVITVPPPTLIIILEPDAKQDEF